MKAEIIFSKRAIKEFKKLEKPIQKRIDVAIKQKLEKDPNAHLIPLLGSLKFLYKFRVGDYRLVCRKEEGKLLIFPSYIHHAVEENLSDQDRVVISFNIDIK